MSSQTNEDKLKQETLERLGFRRPAQSVEQMRKKTEFMQKKISKCVHVEPPKTKMSVELLENWKILESKSM